LKSTCEGFDHQLFDEVVTVASSFADENVEPFSLWEYPCFAAGSSGKIFESNFTDVIKDTESTLKVDLSEGCNGVALWVEWKIDEKSSVACGPSNALSLGELINWKMGERQGVHLIPNGKIEAGKIEGITIRTRFCAEEERLVMDFNYRYQTL
jgi:hypothetical protein